jgi:para-aminobenzoate synthetase
VSCADKELPFDFAGGFVGYFGYEMKHEAGAFPDRSSTTKADTPDAAFMFADRVLAFDHVTHAVYLLCLGLKPRSKEDEETEERASREWFDHIEQRLAASDQVTSTKSPAKFISPSTVEHPAIPFTLQRPYEQYKGDIKACLEEISRGDSYELCLTNKLTTPFRPDPLALYLSLRSANPAPFGSFLRLEPDLHILSTSPERFLSVDNYGIVECKPIKGTRPRGSTPEKDEELKARLQTSPKGWVGFLGESHDCGSDTQRPGACVRDWQCPRSSPHVC